MNTILGWQIFSPIPFSEFNPAVYGEQQPFLDVNRKCGRFDSYNNEHLSFYAKDYLVGECHKSIFSHRGIPM